MADAREHPGHWSTGIAGLICLCVLAVAFLWHISVGAKEIPFAVIVEALFTYNRDQFDHIVVHEIRLPRALMAVFVGAGLAVAGALMQGVTRNPLADPGLLGLMAGATFAVVVASLFSVPDFSMIPLIAAAGALIAAVFVWLVASAVRGGATPMSMVLAGAAMSAFLGALTTALLLIDQQSFEQLRVWMTGTLTVRPRGIALWSYGWLCVGLLIALAIARQVTTLAMGDETATGLGVNIRRLRIAVLSAVVLLTAASVSLVGPMGFVGLVTPHFVRLIVGFDYRWVIPGSALAGAVFLLLTDIVARTVLAPVEISTGLVTAFIGAPVLVWLVKTRL
ncbi:MAG: iron ABC transporter permease [Pseudomonadota bacterium]